MEQQKTTAQQPNNTAAVSLPPKPRIIYTPSAWTKQCLLIMSQRGEVGWHCTVETVGENIWKVTDVIVYPQTVSGTTVTTDELQYSNWLGSQPDNIFNALKMHCHSHVDMSTSPSGVDEADKDRIIEQFSLSKPEQFYIFMIWNKRLEFSADIYTVRDRIRWGSKDVTIEIEGLGEINQWLEKATQNVYERKESKVWTLVKVTSSLIRPNSATASTSLAAAASAAPSVNYWRDWE